MFDARREMNLHGLAPADVAEGISRGRGHRVDPTTVGCTRTCHSVIPTYYPADPGHDAATTALLPLLRDPDDSSAASVLYGYPHVMKTGGTSLSIVLAHTTSPLCGSRVSEHLSDAALDACERGERDADSRSYIPNGDNFVPRQVPARANVSVLYGHADASWILARFPRARLLVLLRRPVPHRLAWFQEFKGTAARYRTGGNLSLWIRSAGYLSLEHSIQLKQYDELFNGQSDASGSTMAEALVSHPSVAWVGVADNWLASMLLLEDLIGVALVQFAAQLTVRFKGGSPFARRDAAKPVTIAQDGTVDGHQVHWTTRQPAAGTDTIAEVYERHIGLGVKLGSGAAFHSSERATALQISTDDYRHLLALEAKEVQLVDTIERSISRKAADLARRRRGWR